MRLISKLLVVTIALLSVTSLNAQVNNLKTETVKVYGNCGMCKKNIEKAGNFKKVALVNWNKSSKLAIISYDSTKTSKNEILKRIALAGYDSEEFLAPADAYSKLDACCQYVRNQPSAISNQPASELKADGSKQMAEKMVMTDSKPMHDMSSMASEKGVVFTKENIDTIPIINNEVKKTEASSSLIPHNTSLLSVFENYFLLKDALIASSGSASATAANNLLTTLNAVKMEELSMEVHTVWMKVQKDLVFDAEHISETKDVGHQREHFSSLSKNMYTLLKAVKPETTTYYQFCPMYNKGKGANWLSKEDNIKNPYYGSQMLTCG